MTKKEKRVTGTKTWDKYWMGEYSLDGEPIPYEMIWMNPNIKHRLYSFNEITEMRMKAHESDAE